MMPSRWQIFGWVVPDIHAAMKFLSNALGIAGFHPPAHMNAEDLNMSYYGYHTLGVATEITGVTNEGEKVLEQMKGK